MRVVFTLDAGPYHMSRLRCRRSAAWYLVAREKSQDKGISIELPSFPISSFLAWSLKECSLYFSSYSKCGVHFLISQIFQIKVKTQDASQVQQPEEEGGRGRGQGAQEDQAAGERGQVRLPEEG